MRYPRKQRDSFAPGLGIAVLYPKGRGDHLQVQRHVWQTLVSCGDNIILAWTLIPAHLLCRESAPISKADELKKHLHPSLPLALVTHVAGKKNGLLQH